METEHYSTKLKFKIIKVNIQPAADESKQESAKVLVYLAGASTASWEVSVTNANSYFYDRNEHNCSLEELKQLVGKYVMANCRINQVGYTVYKVNLLDKEGNYIGEHVFVDRNTLYAAHPSHL